MITWSGQKWRMALFVLSLWAMSFMTVVCWWPIFFVNKGKCNNHSEHAKKFRNSSLTCLAIWHTIATFAMSNLQHSSSCTLSMCKIVYLNRVHMPVYKPTFHRKWLFYIWTLGLFGITMKNVHNIEFILLLKTFE